MHHSRTIAEWAGNLSLGEATPASIAKAADHLLDFLGVAAGGLAEEASARTAAEFARQWRGAGNARLIDRDAARVGAEAAAFAHGVAGHSLEMDDVHNGSSLHPGVAVIPAALAAAEEVGADAGKLLEAILAGYEAVIRIGEAATPAAVYGRGFHPTGVCGSFSSALAAAKIMGLTTDQTVHALGLAWSFASGNMSFQNEGSWAKRIQIGHAARCGIQAARLASIGAVGPERSLEAEGFFHSYSGAFDETKLSFESGAPLKILEAGVKPYACCRYNQTPIDLVLELRAEGVRPEDVASAEIALATTGMPLVAWPPEAKRRPKNSVQAQFSLYYSAAVAWIAGEAGPPEYRAPWLTDLRVRDLADKISVVSDEGVDRRFPRQWPARIRVKTSDGRTVERFAEEGLGDPSKPLKRDALARKFDRLLCGKLADPARANIRDWVFTLPHERPVEQLLDLVRGGWLN